MITAIAQAVCGGGTGEGADRAQSEVTSFALIVALSIGVFGLVLTAGLPAIESAQSDEATLVVEQNFEELETAAQRSTGNQTGVTVEQALPPGDHTHRDAATQLIFRKDGVNESSVRGGVVQYHSGDQQTLSYDLGLYGETTPQGTEITGIPDTSPGVTVETIYREEDSAPMQVSWELYAATIDQTGGRTADRGQSIEYFVTPRQPTSSVKTLVSEPDDSVTVEARTDNEDLWATYFELHPAFHDVSQEATLVEAELEPGTSLSMTIYHLDFQLRG